MRDPVTQLRRLQRLKEVLSLRATGRDVDYSEYEALRRQVLTDSYLKSRIPSFIRDCTNLSEFWAFIKPKFSTYAERREFLRQQFLPLITDLEFSETSPIDQVITETLSTIDWPHVQEAWRKALDRRTDDPDGAITAARTLIESVCKHILELEEIKDIDKFDLPRLYNVAAKTLKLAPAQATERVVRQILGGCVEVVNGIAALRNKTGDAHGKGRGEPMADLMQAELAVSLAGAVASFLVKRLIADDAFE